MVFFSVLVEFYQVPILLISQAIKKSADLTHENVKLHEQVEALQQQLFQDSGNRNDGIIRIGQLSFSETDNIIGKGSKGSVIHPCSYNGCEVHFNRRFFIWKYGGIEFLSRIVEHGGLEYMSHIICDKHQNIICCYGKEMDEENLYICLERANAVWTN